VRIVTATNRDLKQCVKEKTFREDLFYRIHVLSITLPPLRERTSDIQLLAKNFAEKESTTLGRPPVVITSEVLNLFDQYNWPGNVRELENTIKRAIVMMDGNMLTMETLPMDFKEKALSSKAGSLVGKMSYKEAKKTIVEAFDRMYFVRLLHEHKGVVSKAARAAGIHEKNMYTKLKNLKINIDSFRDESDT
ncbi:MAG: sigma 54-interacting transcriptional regulator, partial [bacterium]|nr:sigma 54-interacting transcriptional regulator [bacterium]